jgi:hypothetical protein
MLRIENALLGVAVARYLAGPPAWLAACLLVVATLLVAGVLTPVAATAFAIGAAAAGVETGGLLGSVVALHALIGIALAMLGAGAYSIDARVFGRRVISLDG